MGIDFQQAPQSMVRWTLHSISLSLLIAKHSFIHFHTRISFGEGRGPGLGQFGDRTFR